MPRLSPYEIANDALSGEPEVTKRDSDLMNRGIQQLLSMGYFIGSQEVRDLFIPHDSDESLGLPVPRLQLRWHTRETCVYELIIPCTDIRVKDGTALAIPFGHTDVTGGSETRPLNSDGTIDTPFRDGAHIQWDAKALNLPMYAVWNNLFTKLEMKA